MRCSRRAFALLGVPLLLAACWGDECPRSEGVCEGQVVVECDYERSGHAVEYSWMSKEDCAETDRRCVEVDRTAFCAESAQPSPPCDPAATATAYVCEGSTSVQCRRGYVVSRVECEGACEGGVCVGG